MNKAYRQRQNLRSDKLLAQPQKHTCKVFHLVAIQMPLKSRIRETNAAEFAFVDLQDQSFIGEAHISFEPL